MVASSGIYYRPKGQDPSIRVLVLEKSIASSGKHYSSMGDMGMQASFFSPLCLAHGLKFQNCKVYISNSCSLETRFIDPRRIKDARKIVNN